MAVKIRLARHGAHKAPYYRIVVADSRARRDGRYIEQVGTYNPLTEPKKVTMDLEKIDTWVQSPPRPLLVSSMLSVRMASHDRS